MKENIEKDIYHYTQLLRLTLAQTDGPDGDFKDLMLAQALRVDSQLQLLVAQLKTLKAKSKAPARKITKKKKKK